MSISPLMPVYPRCGVCSVKGDHCHRIDEEGWPGLNRHMITFDRGLHAAVEKAGRFAEANLLKESLDLFLSAQRACLHCHLIAREEESFPPVGKEPEAR